MSFLIYERPNGNCQNYHCNQGVTVIGVTISGKVCTIYTQAQNSRDLSQTYRSLDTTEGERKHVQRANDQEEVDGQEGVAPSSGKVTHKSSKECFSIQRC